LRSGISYRRLPSVRPAPLIDNVIVTDTGFELLPRTPRDLIVVD
jgi:hypothetical protein